MFLYCDKNTTKLSTCTVTKKSLLIFFRNVCTMQFVLCNLYYAICTMTLYYDLVLWPCTMTNNLRHSSDCALYYDRNVFQIYCCSHCTMSMLYYADTFTNPDLLMQSEIKKFPEGQHTFAMLAEAFNVDVYEARLNMFPNFVSRKREWVEQISSHLHGLKKWQLEDYLAEFLKPDIPFDEVGILMFARMMHKHVAVYFNDLYWTKKVDHDCAKWEAHFFLPRQIVLWEYYSFDQWRVGKVKRLFDSI